MLTNVYSFVLHIYNPFKNFMIMSLLNDPTTFQMLLYKQYSILKLVNKTTSVPRLAVNEEKRSRYGRNQCLGSLTDAFLMKERK